MRAVVQRVSEACVHVQDHEVAAIGHGLLVLIGVAEGDSSEDARYLAEKIANLRVMPDDTKRMNYSVLDTGMAVLIVSQFTLIADTSRGRRPSFAAAADPSIAEPLVHDLEGYFRSLGVTVACGEFGSDMDVRLVNRGPVTIIVDSRHQRSSQLGSNHNG